MAPVQTSVDQHFHQRKYSTRSQKNGGDGPQRQSKDTSCNISSPKSKCKNFKDSIPDLECIKNRINEPAPITKTPTKLKGMNDKMPPPQIKTPSSLKSRTPSKKGSSDNALPQLSPSKRKGCSAKEPCSPPKLKCTMSSEYENKASSVPSGVAITPSSMISQLHLSTPETKKSSTSRKSLFQETNDVLTRAPETNDVLTRARLALHTHAETSLPGREKELGVLSGFIKSHITAKKSGSLYVSGPPGTGKTACLSKVLEELDLEEQCKVVNINCTSIESPKAIYSRIVAQLGLKAQSKSGKAFLEAIEKFLCVSRKMTLILLDEMDQLDMRVQSVLYSIFEWPLMYPNAVILIGVANALDLTDRMLPRLKAKLKLMPELLHFSSYTKQELNEIFTQRLKEANVSDLFNPAALQLLASKVSAVNGDARRALDTARRTVETIIDAGEAQPLTTNSQMSSKVLSQLHLSSDASPLRKSPRKLISVTTHQLLRSPKNGSASSPIKKESSLEGPLKSPAHDSNSVLKENCSPLKSKSAKKLFCDQKEDKMRSLEEEHMTQKEVSKAKQPYIDVKSVMSVVNDVYGSSQGLGRAADGGEELPLHHKLAICTLLLILREGKNKDVNVGKLHDVYRRVCTKRHIEPLDSGAFLSLLGLIEARGILLLPGRGKRNRFTKVCMQWIEEEVATALKDRDLLAAIMRDKSCL